jgi:hypothetical protein
MLPKSVIVCLAATALVVTTALMPTDASAGGRSGPQPGTWNWPPYAEGGYMSRTTCGYVWVNPYPYKLWGQGRWVYECR